MRIASIRLYFKENLEVYDLIMEIAEALFNDCCMSEYSDYYDETCN